MGNKNDIKFQTANTPNYGRCLFRDQAPQGKMPVMEHDPQNVLRGLKDSSKTYKAVVTSDAESAQSSHDLVVKACLKVTYAQHKKTRCRSITEGAK